MYYNNEWYEVKYVDIYDLVFNGECECRYTEEKPSNPYLVCGTSECANCGRGEALIMYKGKELRSHFMTEYGVPSYEYLRDITLGDLMVVKNMILKRGIECFIRYGL